MIMGCIEEEDNLTRFDFDEEEGDEENILITK
jgi:hypothetical protein